jgi:hypothetical protein
MRDQKQALEEARRELRPPEDAFERLLKRRERKRRASRIASGAIGLVIGASALLIVVIVFTNGGDEPEPASTCAVAPSDVTGWWTGDGSGVDIAGDRTARLHGDATFGPGLVGQAFRLDGDGDFVSVPYDPGLDSGTGDFTVALWVNFDSTRGEQILVEKWVQTTLGPPDRQIGWTLTKLEDDRIGFGLDPGAVSSPRLDIPVGTWIHVAARRSGNTLELLMNGEVIASASGRDSRTDADSPASLTFGHRGGPDDTPGSIDERGFFLDGRIDEVKVLVGKALSNEGIRTMVESEASGTRC